MEHKACCSRSPLSQPARGAAAGAALRSEGVHYNGPTSPSAQQQQARLSLARAGLLLSCQPSEGACPVTWGKAAVTWRKALLPPEGQLLFPQLREGLRAVQPCTTAAFALGCPAGPEEPSGSFPPVRLCSAPQGCFPGAEPSPTGEAGKQPALVPVSSRP